MNSVPGHLGFEKARDMLDACHRFAQKYKETRDNDDLIAAVLFGNHTFDWLHTRDLGLSQSDFEAEKTKMKAACPEWDELRKIANGAKHPKKSNIKQSIKREHEWEDDDWWDIGGREGEKSLFIDFNGKEVSLYALIMSFLTKADNYLNRLGK
ncbi:hypothetical protein JHL17_02785 [Azospirillum sp. YIM B02556]|uniref:Uncharacterized protein n=1 Tax=Azospirillum endophyticum TaxID=2800326 RepID=A0ABS1EYT8_9PROT|nr:hypothetical protein [Azospirillum endophyticum]MBK1836328.1 hypothetical protein [Azospirillum endophyticum]